ncbi:MAG: PAS domain S-box protein [Terriglobia bacterium]
MGATKTSDHSDLLHFADQPGCDSRSHIVQFYHDDAFLLDALSRSIGAAVCAGDGAVVIATQAHRDGLERRLTVRGLDVFAVREQGRYISVDAAEMLPRIMQDGQPAAEVFLETVGALIDRAWANAEGGHSRVTVFGELVALLWAQGQAEAAIQLEKLWNRLGRSRPFSLCCSYPIGGFHRKEDAELFVRMCSEHTAVIPAESYTGASSEDERLRSIAELQQRAAALNHERALRQNAEQFQLMVESVLDYAIFMLNPEGFISSWNPGAVRIKGYKASEILGKHFSAFYTPEDVQAGKPERGLKTASVEGRFEAEGWRVRKDGSRFWANVVISALRDQKGKLKGFVKITRDVTEKKKVEEDLYALSSRLLQVQDEERRRLARELHDSAGQTLAVLGMNLAALSEQTDQKAFARLAKENQALVDQLTQEIRTISYLLHPPLLDENGVSDALRWYVEGLTQRSGLDVTLELPEDLGGVSRELGLAIFRIVQECLTNVYRHSRSKTAAIRLARDSAGIHAEIEDNGIGIMPDKLNRLRSPGSGVGLRGMKERIRQFGGSLNIESNGHGTKVSVNIPLPASAAHAD